MAEKRSISVIQEHTDSAAAREIAVKVTGDAFAVIERRLYYPYYRIDAKCRLPTLFGRRDWKVSCLIDGINKTCATTDPFAVRSIAVSVASILPYAVPADSARSVARRYLVHHLSRRLKVISAFDIELQNSWPVFRGFWIAGSRRDTIMIDTVTGLTYPIGKRAA